MVGERSVQETGPKRRERREHGFSIGRAVPKKTADKKVRGESIALWVHLWGHSRTVQTCGGDSSPVAPRAGDRVIVLLFERRVDVR
jgi:hypothetical protein